MESFGNTVPIATNEIATIENDIPMQYASALQKSLEAHTYGLRDELDVVSPCR